jgi:hypothetical protein
MVIARELFRGSPQGHGPFRATHTKDCWIVTSGSGEDLATVTIAAKTGPGSGFHQAAHVNETAEHAPSK